MFYLQKKLTKDFKIQKLPESVFILFYFYFIQIHSQQHEAISSLGLN